MATKTLVISRAEKLFPYWKSFLEGIGFTNVLFTSKEKDALYTRIMEYKPDNLLFGCGFYRRATPFMMMNLLKKLPRMNVAAINIHEYPDDLGMRFIANGVHSYVNIMDGMEEFMRGLCAVRDGGAYIAEGVLKRINMRREFPKPAAEVTEREFEVLGLICSGFYEIEMADTLHVSPKTITNHRTSLYTNLNARNPAELILTALDNGIIRRDGLSFYPTGFTVNPQPVKEIWA